VGGRNVKASSGLFCPFPTQGRAAVSSGSYLDHSDHLSNQGEASFWELYFHVLTMACAENTVNAAAPESVCLQPLQQFAMDLLQYALQPLQQLQWTYFSIPFSLYSSCNGHIFVHLSAFTAVCNRPIAVCLTTFTAVCNGPIAVCLTDFAAVAINLLQYALQPIQQFAMDLLQYAADIY
jgi:hypothetical protein